MKVNNILWGIVFIFVGVVLGLNALNITNINLLFDGWWTLFIIVPCFIDLFKDEDVTGDIIGLIIGVTLLLACNNLIDFNVVWKLMLPFILVVIGVSFIFRDTINNKVKKEIKKLNNNSDEYFATFGEQNVEFSGEKFNGCNLTAVFGSVNCDLREAIIKEDKVINVTAIFGGITIYVPEGVKVKVVSIPIFGGVTNKHKSTKNSQNIIYVNATCLFGGVDIK